MDKPRLRATLAARLERELETMLAAQRSTVEGATHEQAKPENDKDTRALEQSYLARGQALRVDELRVAIAETKAMPLRSFCDGDPIGLSAVVTIEGDKGTQTLFVALHGGGEEIEGVRVVTVRSPLGRAVLGKTAGDDVEFEQAGRVRSLAIGAVR